jgi:hypothetical protein
VPRAELALPCLCLLVACERGGAPAQQLSSAPMPAVRIEAGIVAELQQRLRVPPARARELAEEDALLAAELGRREPALSLSLARLALAREMSQLLLADAERAGPPTEQELTELTNERWWELDRPRMVQVVHAVVMTGSENIAAAALAERIAAAVAQVSSAAEFEQAAKAVPPLDLQVRVETCPPLQKTVARWIRKSRHLLVPSSGLPQNLRRLHRSWSAWGRSVPWCARPSVITCSGHCAWWTRNRCHWQSGASACGQR